ncbi:MAG: hypothetical protein J6X10_02070 [Bacteroidales bacterium]|nr:hypothetical protein [Bacteroidales bacterium]
MSDARVIGRMFTSPPKAKVTVAWVAMESEGRLISSVGIVSGSSFLVQLGSIAATARAIIIFFIVVLF